MSSATSTLVSNYASRLESINKMINKIAEHSAPLVKRHLDLNNPVSAKKHEWVDKVLRGLEDTLAATISSTTASVITVNGGTNSPKAYQGGSSLLLVGNEYMLVSSIITVVTNSTQLFVTRGALSSTPATHADAKQVKIINSNEEAFTANRNDAQYGARQDNYTMVFEKQLILSGSSQAIDAVGSENKMNQQAVDLTSQIMKELEEAFIYSPKFSDSNSNFKKRRAGGFHWHATTRGALNQDKSAGQISFDDIDGVIETYIKNGGDPMKICLLASVRQQRYLNKLKIDRIEGGGQKQSDNTINNMVERYKFGSRADVEVMFHPSVRHDEVYFFQKDLVKVKPLQGRTWKREKLAKTGDTDNEMLVGEYTFEFFNTRETLFRLHNLKVTG